VVRLTQDEINQKLRDIGTAQAKVTNVTLSTDSVAIDLLVGGIKGTLTTGLAVANGNIILAKPRLDGVIGALLPIEKISQLFEDEINKRLHDKTPVQDLHIMDGVIEITLAGK
jgi:energy-converting hydrogenase Eha subunit B